MKRATIVVPVLVMLCFIAYDQWRGARMAREKTEMLVKHWAAYKAARADLDNAGRFVGRDGTKEARNDISYGTAMFMLYGKERADVKEFTTLMAKRFGVSVNPLAGCLVSDPLVAYATSYNAVVRKYIADKFGPGAFDQASRDAFQVWTSNRSPSVSNQSSEPTFSSVTPPAGQESRPR